MSKNIIEIKDFDVFYGDFQAIKSVSMDIEENKVALEKHKFKSQKE